MIRIGFYTPNVMLTSELSDISIFTDHEAVDFSLYAGGTEVLSGRYYALNGSIRICDIAPLIEGAIVGNTEALLADCEIEVYAGSESATHEFQVLYCDKDLGNLITMEWLSQNFLTLTPYRRIAPGGFFEVQWYAADREGISFRVYCTYLNAEGKRDTYSFVQSGNGLVQHGAGIRREIVTLRDVEEKIKSAKRIDTLTLQSVTVRCGNRSLTVFVDPALTGIIPFHYTNCFNVAESLVLPRVTTEKIKVDNSIASLGKSSRFYDVNISKEYEVQSGPLTSDECLQVEQLLTSPDVRIPWGIYSSLEEIDFYALTPIMITDFTSELSDTDEKPNSVKFTWRFMENRPKVSLKESPGIFNDKFQPPYT